LTELHSRLYNSNRANESRGWFESDLYDAGKMNKSIEESGLITQKRAKKEDKQGTSFVKAVENYQIESKVVGKHLIGSKTHINSEKFKILSDYLDQVQYLDNIFSEMKIQSNETREDEIIKTLLRNKETNSDQNRVLLDLQTEIIMMESAIEQEKQVIREGTKMTMAKAKVYEERREKAYRDEKKHDKVMTL
jgi:hypothetical protein